MGKLSYFKIGLFVIAATVIAVIGVVVLGVGTLLKKKMIVETYIDESVQGLDVGSSIKFRGVSVGKVEQITLTHVEYATRRRYVLVRVGLTSNLFQISPADGESPGFLAEIAKGLRVRLAAQGLTGTAYLEADYLDPARNPPLTIDWQPAYPYVPSAQSKITQLSEAVEHILRNFEQVDIQRIADGFEKSLATITKAAQGANFDQINEQAVAFLAEARATNRQLKDLVGAPELKTALADVAAAGAGARRIFERAEKPLSQLLADLPKASESVGRLIQRLDVVSADLPVASGQIKQTLQQLNRLLAGQQYEIQTAVENLRAISENFKEITDNAKKYPAQALFGAPPPPSKVMGR